MDGIIHAATYIQNTVHRLIRLNLAPVLVRAEPSMKMGKGDHHVWGHHPAPKWSLREETFM
jgi:hypothetical protein